MILNLVQHAHPRGAKLFRDVLDIGVLNHMPSTDELPNAFRWREKLCPKGIRNGARASDVP
jgi:hypothetical protein